MPAEKDSLNLEMRVEMFLAMELPGQPKMMHMGTSHLVHDLWREVQRLRAAEDRMHMANRSEA